MSDNVQTITLEILKSIQQGISDIRSEVVGMPSELAEVRTDLVQVNERLSRLEDISRKQRRDTAGLLVIMKSVVGNYREELDVMVRRIRFLEEGGTAA